jgi:uncharacterized protein YndB with AHSA1/START domain
LCTSPARYGVQNQNYEPDDAGGRLLKPDATRSEIMEVSASTTIRRPRTEVWDFCAVHHPENHPRWDPDIRLERTTDEPLGVGSILRRWNTRFGTQTEGAMEITTWEPERRVEFLPRDGDSVIHGYMTVQKKDDDATIVTSGGEFPQADETLADRIRPLMERSLANMKALIEQ